MNDALFERWEYASEGDSLDFKKMNYKFSKATDKEKSEILKDILAMVNSWSPEVRYIVIGIEDRDIKPNILRGIDRHGDDSRIQQFVNSKTSKACRFEYISYTYKEKQFGVFRIPVQDRPVFLRKDYGGLKADIVYVRRGSATEIANPDEVKQMVLQTSFHTPELNTFFFSDEKGEVIGDEISVSLSRLEIIDDIPDYRRVVGMVPGGFLLGDANKEYYRDILKYQNFKTGYIPIRLAVKNSGDVEAENIKVEADISTEFPVIINRIPEEPSRSGLLLKLKPIAFDNSSYKAIKYESRMTLGNQIKVIHAKRTLPVDDVFYISSSETTEIPIQVRLYYNGAEKPIQQTLRILITMQVNQEVWGDVKHNYKEEQ